MQTCGLNGSSSAIVSVEQEVWVKGTNFENYMAPLAQKNKSYIFPQPIISISVGSNTSLFLAENGDVWTCGVSVGQRVDKLPRQLANLPPIQAISCSSYHSYKKKTTRCLFLDADGNVWKHDSTRQKYEHGPRKIGKSSLPPIKSISAASRFSLFLDHEGNVWSQGHSKKGCLGIEGITFQKYPVKIPELCNIMEISSSENCSLFLDEDGTVWACGNTLKYVISSSPCKIKGLPPIRAVSAGFRHSLFLDEEGRVWGRGANNHRVMGSIRDLQGARVFYLLEPILISGMPGEMVGIKAGYRASFYIDPEGFVWATGSNKSSELLERNYNSNLIIRKPTKMDFPPILLPQQPIYLKSARNT